MEKSFNLAFIIAVGNKSHVGIEMSTTGKETCGVTCASMMILTGKYKKRLFI